MIDRALFALPGARRVLAALVALFLARAACIGGQAWGLAACVSDLWGGAALADEAAWLVLFAACFAARQVLACAQDALLEAFAARCASDLRERLVAEVFDQGAPLLARSGTGAVATLSVEGIDQVRSYIHLVFPKSIGLVVVPCALLCWLFPLDWVSGLIALVSFPAIILFMVLLGHTASDEAAAQHATFERMTNGFLDSLRGLDTLKLLGRSRAHGEQVFAQSERFREATMRVLRVAMLSSAVLDLFATGVLAAVAIMLGFRLVDGSIALFPALFALMCVPEFFRPIREFAADYHASLDGRAALRSVLAIVGEGNTEGEGARGERDAARVAGVPSAPCASASPSVPIDVEGTRFEARDLAFRYPEEDACALAGVSFSCAAPARVGIIGASGAGKSTLANLLAGLADPAAGTFSVGGRTLSTLRDPAWLARVAYIPQAPYVFHMSVRDNVRLYCPDADDAAVARAVAAVGLDSLVAELPDGLGTLVGEGARGLSGGQAQRIALARALLDPARQVLVFDEPTAHLDIETELDLKERMLPLMEGKLVFFATHRLHWTADMDVVLVVEGGRVVDAGAPANVAARAAYQRIAAAQGGAR